jgi:hypothetical protein
MKRSTLAFACIVALACFAQSALGAAGDGVWVNGTVYSLVTGPPKTTAPKDVQPLYVIAPVSAAHPLHSFASAAAHGFGAHDHVTASVFAGPCDITLVMPGPKAGRTAVRMRTTLTPAGTKPLVYAALLGGRMQPLTSAARIDEAKRAGLVVAVDTHTVIYCAVAKR